ncbi:MAG: XdhC family protein [Pseudomonadota bacterium]|nr:XdhC family protein [Pseudomonadota bacterium]
MNEKEIFLKAEEWLIKEFDIAIISVIKTWGSSPRPVGSSMIVNSKNEIVGSVSGGCIENFVFAKALEVIKSNRFQILEFGVTNSQAWEVGLTCGGRIKVLVEKFSREDLGIIKKINNIFNSEGHIILATNLSNGRREVLEKKNSEYISSKIEKIKTTNWFLKLFTSQFKVIIIGAVHISEPLIALAKTLSFKIYLIDPRNNFSKEKFQKNVHLLNEWPDEGLKKIGIDEKTSIVTLTHDPKLDDPALLYALSSNAMYIGSLGSKKTHAARIKRLEKKGFKKEQLNRIHGPIGLSINAKTPAEIACSIISQIILRKNKNEI